MIAATMGRFERAAYIGSVWLVLLFVLAPLCITVWVAFFSNTIMSFPPEGYTLSWFVRAWELEAFRTGFLLSVQIGVLAAVLGLLFGVPAALAIARHRFPGRETINMILMSPIMVPAIVAGIAIYIFYVEVQVMTGIQFAATLPGLVIAHTLIAIPWVLRLVIASLSGLDPAVEEASLSLGASRVVTFFRITLPIIKPGIVAGGLFAFIVSFGDLEKSLLLVGPGRSTLPIAMLNYLEFRTDPTIMSVATIQILIIGAALIISDRYVRLSRTF
ncbi:ABC transporter permease [Brucella grignonensis]|uniref:ABC transporter permease n=1 Tax=Brucella grignonensis TaxID=94627 RepID=UPI0035BC38A3